MSQPRKKYNRARTMAQLEDLRARNLEQRIRLALIGASLSYNSTWGNTEYHPSGFDKAMALVNNDVDFICAAAVSWPFNWKILLTVYCTDDYGVFYDQPVVITAENKPMSRLEGYIETEVLPMAKGLCNQRHIQNWGYWAIIEDKLNAI